MPLCALLSGNEAIAQLVLQHMQPNDYVHAASASQWPPSYRPWLYLVLSVSKCLTAVLDKEYLWEAYFAVQCAHLRSPLARFCVTTAGRCRHRHPRCALKEGDITVNLTFITTDTRRSFARQIIPQFIQARDKLYEYFPPFDVPGSVFAWDEDVPSLYAHDDGDDDSTTSSCDEDIHCGRIYQVGDIPVRLHRRCALLQPCSLDIIILDGDVEGLNADLNADVSPAHSFECSECGEEQHRLFPNEDF